MAETVFNFYLEYTSRKFQETQEELKLEGTVQLLIKGDANFLV
jgi:hypothetical protein